MMVAIAFLSTDSNESDDDEEDAEDREEECGRENEALYESRLKALIGAGGGR